MILPFNNEVTEWTNKYAFTKVFGDYVYLVVTILLRTLSIIPKNE